MQRERAQTYSHSQTLRANRSIIITGGAAYVKDPYTGYFWEGASGFYYDAISRLYYSTRKQAYYHHDPTAGPAPEHRWRLFVPPLPAVVEPVAAVAGDFGFDPYAPPPVEEVWPERHVQYYQREEQQHLHVQQPAAPSVPVTAERARTAVSISLKPKPGVKRPLPSGSGGGPGAVGAWVPGGGEEEEDAMAAPAAAEEKRRKKHEEATMAATAALPAAGIRTGLSSLPSLSNDALLSTAAASEERAMAAAVAAAAGGGNRAGQKGGRGQQPPAEPVCLVCGHVCRCGSSSIRT